MNSGEMDFKYKEMRLCYGDVDLRCEADPTRVRSTFSSHCMNQIHTEQAPGGMHRNHMTKFGCVVSVHVVLSHTSIFGCLVEYFIWKSCLDS